MEYAFGMSGSNESEFFVNAIPETQLLPWKKDYLFLKKIIKETPKQTKNVGKSQRRPRKMTFLHFLDIHLSYQGDIKVMH